jgi:peptidoglycan biosynthesis protein MviN/MurJ (putative lipid II flippase)
LLSKEGINDLLTYNKRYATFSKNLLPVYTYMYLRLKSDEEISYENNIIKRTILCPLFIIVLLIVIPFVIFAIYKYFGHQDSVLLLILILAALIFLILFMLPIRALVNCVLTRNKKYITYPISAVIINTAILVGLLFLMIKSDII